MQIMRLGAKSTGCLRVLECWPELLGQEGLAIERESLATDFKLPLRNTTPATVPYLGQTALKSVTCSTGSSEGLPLLPGAEVTYLWHHLGSAGDLCRKWKQMHSFSETCFINC